MNEPRPIDLTSSYQNIYIGDPLPSQLPDYEFQRAWNYYYPVVEKYYVPIYKTFIDEPNKVETAFKIAQKLEEKKMVTIKTVKDFIDLVNEIVKIL